MRFGMILQIFRKNNVVGQLYLDDDTEKLMMRQPKSLPNDIVIRVLHAFTKENRMFSAGGRPLVGHDGQIYEWELAGWNKKEKKEEKPKKKLERFKVVLA
jgi:hypothetical protein